MPEELIFRLRKIFTQVAFEHGLNASQDRFQVQQLEDAVRLMFLIATQEEEVFIYPVNFLTKLGQKWHTFKAQYLRWCRRFFPLGITQVWAISKYPNVNVPIDFVGSEYVHFRVIEDKELYDER